MTKSNLHAAIMAISLDRAGPTSLQAQLTQALRKLVHERQLQPNDRLPASRLLAAELSVSRITVTSAFDQLVSEGYLQGRRGSGMYVAADLPDLPISTTPPPSNLPPLAKPSPLITFESAAPDLREFPFTDWARLMEQSWRAPSVDMLNAPSPFGWPDLRQALVAHLRDWRGLKCHAGQIVITSGLTEAIRLILTALPNRAGNILVEDPGHDVLRSAITHAGFHVRARHVDADGLPIDPSSDTDIAAIAVTPSRQFPLGMTMPLSRRLALLQWSRATDGYIIEDDFDGEYRFQGQPLPAMMSLDDRARVIYVGSFSQVLFHGLRLGFVVLPETLMAGARDAINQSRPTASLAAQPALARFIETGGFATHIRRMRRLYAQRQKTLIAAFQHHVPHVLTPEPTQSGLHVIANLAPDAPVKTDIELAQTADRFGVKLRPLSRHYAGPVQRQGAVLGFAAFTDSETRRGAEKLAKAFPRP